MDVTGRIAQANGRLKSNRVGVRIEQIGEKLYLQATLPPKPDSTQKKSYQQRIALGVGAHSKGVSLAETEARKVGALLDCGEFSWQPYLIARGKLPQTIGDWLKKFEKEYRHTVCETTWRTEYHNVFKHLDYEAELTSDLLRDAIDTVQPNTRHRKRYCTSLGKLAEFAGVEVNFKPLQGSYSYTEVDPRTLPTDQQIVECFYSLKNPAWQYAYGLIATFGLRNHEVFFLDTEALEKGGHMVNVLEGKSGKHLVWACYPEWVDQFGLRIKRLPDVTGRRHEDFGNRVSQYFGRADLPFTAYDLRHRWAVRTLEFGLPSELAAKQMGHSVAVHERIYHHWITADTHQKAFDLLMLRSDRPKPPDVAVDQ